MPYNSSEPTRYARIHYYQATKHRFFAKSAKNQLIIMELKQPKQEFSESISFHENESIFPFKIMKHDTPCTNEQGESDVTTDFKIVVGNAIISNKDFFTLEDAVNYINSKPWELIVNLFCYTLDMNKNE